MGLRSLAVVVFATGSLVSTSAPAATVFLISGGYVSCRTGWSDPTAAPVFQAALPHLDQKAFVAVCFHSDSTVMSFRSDLADAVGQGDVDALVEAVHARLSAAEPGSKLVVIGHSYGGWAAIKAAAALVHDVDIAYLATIDPVSVVGCPPSAYLEADEPFGPCTESPVDLAADFTTIRDAGVPWVQFYQDRYKFIRSTPIADATRNVFLTYPNLTDFWAWQAHALMDGDQRVWTEITADMSLFTVP